MEQQKEAMKNAAAEVSLATAAPVQSPPSAHSLQRTLMTTTYEPITSFATSASSLYTVSTVNSTVVSPSVSPTYSTVSQTRQHSQVDTYHKQTPTVESAELYAKASPLSQFTAYAGRETGRIPPISHLSPKHIRQSQFEHNMSMSLPVSLTPVSLAKDITSGKESLSAAEVETQIAVLQSQIAAVNRNLQASQTVPPAQEEVPVPVPVPHPAPRQGRRKAASTDDATATYVPPPYPKKTRQQSPVSNRVSTESALPPLHSSMDIMSRLHRLDTESIPESLRSQNIQSTLEAFEALRTQTFPPNPEALRTQIANEIENIQNTAQDMSIHHVTTEREQVYPVTTEEYTAVTTDREQSYPTTVVPSERDQTYQSAPSSTIHVKGKSSSDAQYSRISVAWTSLGPWKLVWDIGSSSHWGLIMAPVQEANSDNLGKSFWFSTQWLYVECSACIKGSLGVRDSQKLPWDFHKSVPGSLGLPSFKDIWPFIIRNKKEFVCCLA